MRRLAALAVLLLLAGCFGDRGPDAGDGTASSTTSGSATSTTTPPVPAPPVVDLLLGFSLQDCRGLSVQQTVPIADVQALLPEGFTAQVVQGTQPAGAGEGAGILAIDLYACGNLTASSAQVPSTYYGQVYTLVEPPAERVPGAPAAAFHEYMFRVLAGEDVLATLWPAAGYETRGGAAQVMVGPPAEGLPVDAGLRTAEATLAAGYRLQATGSTAAPAAVTGAFARYTALADGSVLVWTGTYAFPDSYSAQGMAEVADDDPFGPFEVGGALHGLALLYEGGAMEGMDLRRVFTPL